MRQGNNSTPTAAPLSASPEPESDNGELSAAPLLESVRPPWSETRSSFGASMRRVSSSGLTSRRTRDRAIDAAKAMYERLAISWARMTVPQKISAVFGAIASVVFGLGFMILTGKVFEWLEPVAEDWDRSASAHILLWLLTFLFSFPPMVGWSTIGTVCGYLFGLGKGWLLFTTATVIGSTCSFIVSRTILSSFVHRLMERDKRFAALALTLKYDGLKLLCMIRLCPLPYSICNGAVSTFPTVSPLMYGLATAIISPKFLIPAFVGSRLRVLARDKEQMSAGSKAVNVISLLVSIGIGIFTGWYIYRRLVIRTLARAKQLEEQERTARRRATHADPSTLPPPSAFTDDADATTSPFQTHAPDEEARLGFQDDAVALDIDDDNVAFDSAGYRDDFTDNDSDVFDDGDGQSADETYTLHRHVGSR